MDGQMELHKQKRKRRETHKHTDRAVLKEWKILIYLELVLENKRICFLHDWKKKVIKVNHNGAHP